MRSSLFCLGALLATVFATSTPSPADQQVNTYTTDSQDSPEVARDAVGNVVVVWTSRGSSGTDSDENSIQGRRYASDGSTLGGDFQVNTYTTSIQYTPAIASDADGNFVVVWASHGSGGTDSSVGSIQAQRFASDGSTLGGQVQVNSHTPTNQKTPAVALDADGDFVVVWAGRSSPETDSQFYSIQGRRFGSDGSASSGDFQVNVYTTGYQELPFVAMAPDGAFVVVWASRGSSGTDSSFRSVQGRRFASDGSAAGGEFQVNTYTTSNQVPTSVSSDPSGIFVVVWQSSEATGDDAFGSIRLRRYSSGGAPASGEVQVNTYTTGVQREGSVAVDAAGEFVVVWTSSSGSESDSDYGIQAQRYSSDGTASGAQFQVNAFTTGQQREPAIQLAPTGELVVVWSSLGSGGTDTSSASIQRTDAGFVPVDLVGFEIE